MIRRSFIAAMSVLAVLFAPFVMATGSHSEDSRLRPDLCTVDYWRSHPVRFVDLPGFFPSPDSAESAALSIDAERFEVEVREAAVGSMWSLLARYRALPSTEQFLRDKSAMITIGRRYGADALMPGCVSFLH